MSVDIIRKNGQTGIASRGDVVDSARKLNSEWSSHGRWGQVLNYKLMTILVVLIC